MEGRIALVTGAGSGLGAADAVAKEVDGEAVPFDVADPAAVDPAIDGVVERHGRLDVVVDNAGIAPDRPDLTERSMAAHLARMGGQEVPAIRSRSTLSDEAWDRVIRVHLDGTFHCARAAMRHMEVARWAPS